MSVTSSSQPNQQWFSIALLGGPRIVRTEAPTYLSMISVQSPGTIVILRDILGI